MATTTQVFEALYRQKFADETTAGASSAARALGELAGQTDAAAAKAAELARVQGVLKQAQADSAVVVETSTRALAAQRIGMEQHERTVAHMQGTVERAQAAVNALTSAQAVQGRQVEETTEKVARQERTFRAWVNVADPLAQAANRVTKAQKDLADFTKAAGDALVGVGPEAEQAQRAYATLEGRVEKLKSALEGMRAAEAGAREGAEAAGQAYDAMAAKMGTAEMAARRLAMAVAGANAEAVRRVNGGLSTQQSGAQEGINSLVAPGMRQNTRDAADSAAAFGAEIDALRNRVLPAAAAMQTYRDRLSELSRAHRLGAIDEKERAAETLRAGSAYTRQVQAMDGVTEASKRATNAFGLQRYQVTNLTAQFVDFGVQISSGGGILLPLIQQSPQAIDAVGGVSKAWSLLTTIFTPARLAMGAVAVGMGAVTAASISQQNELAGMATRLRAVKDGYGETAQAAVDASKKVAESGVGVNRQQASNARVSLAASAAGSGIMGLDYSDLTTQAANLAARLGTDFPTALGKIEGAMRNPVALVDELRLRGFPGMDSSLRLTIQRLTEAGEPAAAFGRLMTVVGENTRGAAREGSDFQNALKDMKSAFSSIWDDITAGLARAGTPLLTWMGEVMTQARRIREANLNGQGRLPDDGMQPEYDAMGNATGNRIPMPNRTSSTALGPSPELRYSQQDIAGMVVAAAARNGVSPDFAMRVARTESGFNQMDPRNPGNILTSSAGALGTMQLMPGTAAGLGVNPLDTAQNIEGGVRYLKQLLARFGSEEGAYAAYNMGPGNEAGTNGYAGYLRRQELYAARPVGDAPRLPDETVKALERLRQPLPANAPAGPVMVPEVTVRADRVTLEPFGPNAAPAEIAGARVARGLDIATGAPGAPQVSGATPEARAASAARLLPIVQAAKEAATAAGDVDVLEKSLRDLRTTMAAGEGAEARFLRSLTESADAATSLDPRVRTVTEATRAYRDAMKAAGQEETDAGRREAVTQALRNLGGAYLTASQEAMRGVAAQDRIAEAWGRGAEAVRRLAAEDKAREVVRASGLAGTAGEEAEVQKLADAYERLGQRQADNGLRSTNDQTRRNLEYMREEGRLVGLSADERERELAAFKARQDAAASGSTDRDAIATSERLARASVDQRRSNEQAQNSVTAIRDLWSETADTIRTSLVGAIASGEAKAVSFGNILRAIQTNFTGKAIELLVTNPLSNSMDGGTRASFGGSGGLVGMLGSLFSSSGGGSSSAVNGARPGSSSFSLGDTGSWGSGISKMWDSVKGWFGGGSGGGGLGSVASGVGVDGNAISGMLGGTSSGSAAGLGSAGGGFGSIVGAVGMGYGLGSTLGGYLAGAKNPARQQNAQIGAGGGALAGAGVGFVAGGPVGAAIGAIIGGVAGGAGGSLFGPKGSFAGGVGSIGIDGDGKFTNAGVNSKNYDSSEITRATNEAVLNVNRALRSQRVSLTAAPTTEVNLGNGRMVNATGNEIVAMQGFGGDARMAEPDLLRAIKGRGTTGNEVRDTVLRNSKADSIDDLMADVQWSKDVYEPLMKTGSAASEFRTSLDGSLKTLDEAILKAREMGIAEQTLVDKRGEAIAAAYQARNDQVQNLNIGLQGREMAATGRTDTAFSLYSFDTAAQQELRAMDQQMKNLGFTAEEAGGKFAETAALERTLAAERLNLVRNLIRAEEDRARRLFNTTFSLDQDSLASSGRGNTAALLAFDNQGTDSLIALRRTLEDLSLTAEDVAARVAQASGNLAIARRRMEEDQAIALDALNGGLVDRYQQATGTYDDLNNQLARLDRQHARERIELARQEGANLTQLALTQSAERASIAKAEAEKVNTEALNVGRSIRSFLDSLSTSPQSGRSPTDAFQNASLNFERDVALAGTGDADASGRVTGSAQTLLSAASAMYASSEEFTKVRDYIESALAKLPQTVSYDAQTVELLKESNASDLAARVQLQIIAQRSGGEAGAGIVRAAVEVGYSEVVAALSSTASFGWALEEALAAAQIDSRAQQEAETRASLQLAVATMTADILASTTGDTAQLLVAMAGLQSTAAGIAGSSSEGASAGLQTLGQALRIAAGVENVANILHAVNGTLIGGTNAWLALIRSAVQTMATNLASGVRVTNLREISVNGGNNSWNPEGGGSDGSGAAGADSSGDGGNGGNSGGAGAGNGDGGDYAHGGAFLRGMRAFATGGTFTNRVVSAPTVFNMGLMGEAGPEAIMPLVSAGGGLAVRVIGGGGRETSAALTRAASGHLAVEMPAFALGDTFSAQAMAPVLAPQLAAMPMPSSMPIFRDDGRATEILRQVLQAFRDAEQAREAQAAKELEMMEESVDAAARTAEATESMAQRMRTTGGAQR